MDANPSDLPADDLVTRVYAELRRMAKRQMAGERQSHTLQATALVNEVWLRLREQFGDVRDDPGRFFAAAATSMRRILIEHARAHGRHKRGGDLKRLSLDVVQVADSADLDQVLAIDAAIEGLREISERAAQLLELRFFSGLTEVEAAESIGISERTARREWTFARAWLFQQLNEPG